ncbi:hypothetical protein [Streptomyces altiplanensis]
MGLFARFRRKSKDVVEASPEEAQAGALTGGTPEEAAAEGAAEKGAETPGAAEGEGVEIPKQQSADEAADNEAGENAHK